ncbi:MAG: MCP four helix bundle domain-containing protein, partial [Candidatus Hydrothermarchaeales archaeon]
MGITNRIKGMKIGKKLLLGFMILAFLVAVTGAIGITSLNSVGAAGDLVLDEKVPIADASMEATIAVISGRDAMGEYLLTEDQTELAEIEAEFKEYVEDFDMWHDAILYGTDSDQFKTSASGAMWIKDGLQDSTIVAVAADSEIATLTREAGAYHEQYADAALNLMEAQQQQIESRPKAGEKMEEMDAAGVKMLEKAVKMSFSNNDMNLIWEQLMTVNDYLITGSQEEITAFQETKVEVE